MAILDPVRVAEDYATLDQISRGRIELVIGKGENVDCEGEFRPALKDVTTAPRPYAGVPRIWHGSATSLNSPDLAAKHGDPLFTANAIQPRARTRS